MYGLFKEILLLLDSYKISTPLQIIRFGRPAGEKRVYVDLAKKPTGAANLRI
jgi:hypothetical protein